jgi:hypothetical protein
MKLQKQFDSQHFSNDYELVNGGAMHTRNPENFHVPKYDTIGKTEFEVI